jgi:prepilin-type N-terminal cleavage/methylation domain-containing protein
MAGFTLVEIVVVLLIFSVIIGMAALITRGVTAAQKRSLTATRIATVEAAIVQHVQPAEAPSLSRRRHTALR